MAKRGRPPKVSSGAGVKSLAQLKKEGHPDVKFLGDLEHTDVTIVHGKEDGFTYRYALEEKMGLRKSQGYVVEDRPDVSTNAPGGGKVWPAEGSDAKYGKRNLILMKIPTPLAETRRAVKAEKIKEASEAQTSQVDSDVANAGEGGGSVLSRNDSFVQGLK